MVFCLCVSLSYMEFEQDEFDFLYNMQRFTQCFGRLRKNMGANSNEMRENFIPSSEKSMLYESEQ